MITLQFNIADWEAQFRFAFPQAHQRWFYTERGWCPGWDADPSCKYWCIGLCIVQIKLFHFTEDEQ